MKKTPILLLVAISCLLILTGCKNLGEAIGPGPTPTDCKPNNYTCMCCTTYAEAGGTKVPDICKEKVACVIKNRIHRQGHARGKLDDECEVVSQPGQFAAYNSVRYKACCSGDFSKLQNPKAEKNESNKICNELLKDLDCTGFNADFFDKAGSDFYPKQKGYQKVTVEGCKTFDFYDSSPTPTPEVI